MENKYTGISIGSPSAKSIDATGDQIVRIMSVAYDNHMDQSVTSKALDVLMQSCGSPHGTSVSGCSISMTPNVPEEPEKPQEDPFDE